jgi:hypothetical protein
MPTIAGFVHHLEAGRDEGVKLYILCSTTSYFDVVLFYFSDNY